MKTFENLNQNEKNMLLKIPAYISLLAANADGEMDEVEKDAAIELTHIKTYSSDPVLSDFYNEAEKEFLSTIDQLNNYLPKGKKEREQAINRELSKMEPILLKLGKDFVSTMHESMESYMMHVSKAHHSVITSFVIPVYIKGLTD